MVSSLWTKTRLFAVPYHLVYRNSLAFIKIKNEKLSTKFFPTSLKLLCNEAAPFHTRSTGLRFQQSMHHLYCSWLYFLDFYIVLAYTKMRCQLSEGLSNNGLYLKFLCIFKCLVMAVHKAQTCNTQQINKNIVVTDSLHCCS